MITNGFEHGQKIRAEHLRKEFGCSASTVREALFRLSTLGLVQFQEQRGF
ncbi:MAG TPA: GntR family transcriptional regulator, partial [Rhodobacteraceae bacterium]|nr:GntR family transcriptional regulator [Paracoccaceae bacterium]